MTGWQFSRLYFLETFSDFFFSTWIPFDELYSNVSTIHTKPYFLISTRFTHLYYPPGSCGHLSLLPLKTIQTIFCKLKTLLYYHRTITSRVSLTWCSLDMMTQIRSHHLPAFTGAQKQLRRIVLLGLSWYWINMPDLSYSCSGRWGRRQENTFSGVHQGRRRYNVTQSRKQKGLGIICHLTRHLMR